MVRVLMHACVTNINDISAQGGANIVIQNFMQTITNAV